MISNESRMHLYFVVENYLEMTDINENFDLWDNCLFLLLDQDIITEEQAQFGYEDDYLNLTVEHYRQNEEILINLDNRQSEVERWYWKHIL